MKSSKKIVMVILILLVVLLMVGVAFAYVYVATDVFRTDKEMFFTYFAQLTSEEDGFVDKRIKVFNEKKEQSAYENSGEITVNMQYPDEELSNIIEKVNDLAIRFSGKVDTANNKVEQNIEVDYGNDVILPINYKQDGNAIGLQSNELAKKYIAVRNENLKQLATSLGIEDVSEIPDKIEVPEEIQDISITDAEIEQLKQIYMPIIQENLLEENFSSEKTDKSASYTLELSNEQIKNIIIKILEATKQNTLIIDKINEMILEQDPEAEKIDVSIIDDLIEELNSEDTSNSIPSLKITLVQSDKKLNQILLQLGENTVLLIEKEKKTESLRYKIFCDILEEAEGQETNSSLFETEKSEPIEAKLFFEVYYNGLNTLANVQENYGFSYAVSGGDKSIIYNNHIYTNTIFKESVSIDNLDNSKAIFLNDYDETQLTPFLTQVGTRLLAINKNQMAKLGLQEDENPIIYSNPATTIIMLGLKIYNDAAESIENVNFSEMEISAFNEKFISYVGEERRGSEVNAMIKTVQNNSLSSAGTEGHFVKVTLDGNEISENVDSSKTYIIEALYDAEGYVIEMKVTTKN